MNIRNLFAAYMVAAALTGCEKNSVESSEQTQDRVTLEVRLPLLQTKLDGTADENRINSLQVFVFDHNGMLEAYAANTSSSLSLSCSSGTKEVVALVNAPDLKDVISLIDLQERKSFLSENAVGSFVMEGHEEATLRSNSTLDIPVFRIAARVALTEVAVKFELEQHNRQTFQIKSVYLLNVAGNRKYLNPSKPDKWHNRMVKESDSPSLTGVTLTDAYATSSSPYAKTHYFYCYPNPTVSDVSGGEWTERLTRLVVEAELGGKLYYYPVTLDEGIESNTAYEVKMLITRPGSSKPDQPVDNVAASFSVTAQPWAKLVTVNETI